MLFIEKITLFNQTVLDCLNETKEEKIISAFTTLGLKILGASFGFVWFNSYASNKLELVYQSPNLPYTPRPPRARGRNYQAMKSSKPDFVSKVRKQPGDYYVTRYMKSFVIIPISYQGNIYGNIVLCFKKPHQFPHEERILCTLIGNSMAKAITIRRLISSEQESRALAESHEARFRALVENSYEIIVLLSREGQIFYASPTAKKIFMRGTGDIVGRNITDFILTKESTKASNYLRQILQESTTTRTIEFLYRRTDNSVGILESIGMNLLNDRSISGIVLNMRDVTERKEAEKMAEQKKLLEGEKLKAKFIADATHELRTPLAIIKAHADFARRSGVSKVETVEAALEAIGSEVTHLAELLSDLTLLTTEEKVFQRKIIREDVSLSELLIQLLRRYRTFAHEKHISLRIGKLPATVVSGDRQYLEKLFTNIIKNAITYNKAGGFVIVSALKNTRDILVTVRDTGIGISDKELPHIFERFYRGERARAKRHEGTGLGLSIVKWITEAHDGTIEVTSALGKGSTFTIRFPLAPKIEQSDQKSRNVLLQTRNRTF